jgi:hypothetical protein
MAEQVRQNLEKANQRVYGRGRGFVFITFLPLLRFRRKQSSVARAGIYIADLLHTTNRGGTISMDVNGKAASGPLTIVSTFNPADPIAWRQWHHWNVMRSIARLRLPSGINVLTVHILTEGNMNLAYFDFKKAR